MYVWRGKNRRDKRNLLLLGETFWGAEKGAKNLEHEDNVLRLERENEHVDYYARKVKALMTQYLTTPNGLKEIDLLLAEQDKTSDGAVLMLLTGDAEKDERIRANVFNVYQQFCVPDSSYIDKNGLKKLFSDLQLTMSQRQFEKYLVKLNIQKTNKAVDFDSFFDVLMEEVSAGQKTTTFGLFKKSDETIEEEKQASLSYKVQRRLQANAAKIILIEHAVHNVKEEARMEYRKAHPTHLVCELCQTAFADQSELRNHTRDQAFHRNLTRQKVEMDARFAPIETIFLGNQGRHLRANRLIHSTELGSLQARIDAAVEDPFRPNIADVGGKRYAQQMKGSFVSGFDAKAGIRPMHKRYGLIRQHLAPMRQKANVNSLYQVTQPQLQEVLHHLLRCKDDFIDTVSTCDNPANKAPVIVDPVDYEPLTDREEDRGPLPPKLLAPPPPKIQEEGDGEEVFTQPNNSHGMCAIVRFQWNMFADNQVYIIGEFTGWKKEEMVCDVSTNKFTIYKQLSPGRYRYRFVIDGVERVDEVASKVADPKGPGGWTNEILVTNTPLYHVHQQRAGVSSPLASMSQKHTNDRLGLVLPPQSFSDKSFLGSPFSTKPSSAFAAAMITNTKTLTSDFSALNMSEQGSETHSVGAIVHISQSDKEGLIRHLKHIDLRNLALYDDGAWTLASYINRNSFIQVIDLSYNSISDDGIQGFSGCLPMLDALHTLKLNGNGFSMDACRYLCDNLANSTSITTLELSNNRLGDDGMEVLCKFMKQNEYLRHLFVDTCYIGDDGLECLHECLHFNRRLRSISLMSNKFTVKGIMQLAKALQYNASVEELILSHNPIGPEAANVIGTMLVVNDTLRKLDMQNIDILAHHSSFGVHGICAGLKVNKHITRLNLKNNNLTDMHATDIAFVMINNFTLTDLDLSGNHITEPWFKDYTYIPTHVLHEMPSIETLRHRNRIHARNHPSTFDPAFARYMDDVPKGKWTFRRKWQREVQSAAEKAVVESVFAKEQERIDRENEYIRTNLAEVMITVHEYLEQEPCKAYIKVLSKAIQQYLFDLGKFDSRQYNQFALSISDIPVIKGKNNVRAASIKLKRSSSFRSTGSPSSRSSDRPGSPKRFLPPIPLPQKFEQNNINIDHFLNAHISVITAIFSQCNGAGVHSLMISPLKFQQAFQMLALPLPLEQVQGAVDATLVQAFNSIGLHKFSDYVLSNAQRLCQENKIARMRILADVLFHPPGQEARTIVYDHLHHATFNELRDRYRSIPENAPMFACPICHKRFVKEKHLSKHMAKGASSSEHRKHRLKEVIHHAQVLFLQDVKHTLTDVFFPAYYELRHPFFLPKHYYPQVFDKIGKEGRPFGVVEANRTVRVLDVFGEYLHVMLHGELGWVRYRDEKQFFLQPACANQEGFDWDKLHIQETTTYYRVNDLLPQETELKVRYQPLADGEVLGYLHRGQVIECLAVIGDWLQVRFEGEDAAWVRWKITTAENKSFLGSLFGSGGGTTLQDTNQSQSVQAGSQQLPDPLSNSSSMGRRTMSSVFGVSRGGSANNPTMGKSVRSTSSAGEDGLPLPPSGPSGREMSNYRFVSPPSSRLSRRGLNPSGNNTQSGRRTPGEIHELDDDLYDDDQITYEIDGVKTKTRLRKNPHISREKIDHFNHVRYGASHEGTSACNLLLLPSHFIPLITPPTLPGQVTQKPPSPLVLTQKQIFDHIMSLDANQLFHQSERLAAADRNDIFFRIGNPPSPKSFRQRKKKVQLNTLNTMNSISADSTDSPLMMGSIGGSNQFGVSFKDDVYGVQDDEDAVDEAILHDDSLQKYDFIKQRRGGITKV